ncbi:MAG: histidine phosphatase family protein [Armatimonadota bacterium]|nr:histidine phosphatase family protein [Armatimonadota bacterium]
MREGARLLLVRHGHHAWLSPPINRLAGRLPGVHLSPRGQAEARALARRLASDPPDRIVTSPLERAAQTAAIIASALGMDVTTDARLTETAMGIWEGVAVSEIMIRYPEQWHAWRTAPDRARVPGMEPVEAIGARMAAAAVEYLTAGGTTLLVSHQDPLLALVCRLLELPWDAMRRMEISPGSLSVFEVTRGRPVLVMLNSVPGELATSGTT